MFSLRKPLARKSLYIAIASALLIITLNSAQQTHSQIVSAEFGNFQEACELAGQDDTYDIQDHGCDTIREIGPLPAFSCVNDGKIIPITFDDQPIQNHIEDQSCDRPPWLGLGRDGQCIPYARTGRLPGLNKFEQPDPDVAWAFICRRYALKPDSSTGEVVNPNRNFFEDVAIVGHNKKTGATAFFQTLSSGKPQYRAEGVPTSRVPPPHEPGDVTPAEHPKAKDFWFTPDQTARINCHSCHDSDAWIHTPYIDQVCEEDASGQCKKDSDGKNIPIVPRGFDTATNQIEDFKYWFVGKPFKEQWSTAPNTGQPRGVFFPPGNKCVSCHLIGNSASIVRFTELTTTGVEQDATIGGYVSEKYSKYPDSHWMPLYQSQEMSERRWKRIYERHIQQIIQCRNTPDMPECGFIKLDSE